MGLFSRRRPAASQPQPPRDANDDRWWTNRFGPTAAGVNVTVERAITVPVVFDCLQVLSQTVGGLPGGMFERFEDGSKKPQPGHPLALVLNDPNPEMTSSEFFGQMIWDLASEGDSFSEIVAGRFGPISELHRLVPNRMTVERLTDRSRRYKYIDETGKTVYYAADQIWHIRALPLSTAGLRGTSRIEIGREEIGAALALRDFSSRFFANDATPPFVVEHPKRFQDEPSRQNFRDALKRWWGGKRRHSPGLLEDGAKLTRVGVNNDEAQFLETRKDLAYTIAQLWRMPPHKVGLLERATNNNIEHQSLEFVMDTLLPWLELVERSIAKELILNTSRFFFEFNVAGLLRGDLKARYDAYAQGRQWGWLSVNDIRKLENMNPVPGGDAYLSPMNMQPIGQSQPAKKPDAEIVDMHGRAVSRIYGSNIVRLQEYRNAA